MEKKLELATLQQLHIEPDKTRRHNVYPWFEITVKSIDVPKQTWEASVEVHIFWQDFRFSELFPTYETQEFKLDDGDTPVKLSEIFENKLVSEFELEPKYEFLPETSTIYLKFIVSVTFAERMELNRFPLDRQFLNMEFNGLMESGNWHWTLHAPSWVPQEFHKPFAVRMVSSITEYALFSPYVDFTVDPPFKIRLRVERLTAYYYASILLPNFLIVLACFATFPIDVEDASSRLSVSVNLMLAAVAFRFVVQSMLPKVSYLTIMDYYLISTFILLTLLIAENGLCALRVLIPQRLSIVIDRYFMGIFFILWIVIHLLALLVYFHEDFLRVSWKKMDELDAKGDSHDFLRSEKINAPQPSQYCQQEWNRYKNLNTPLERAELYSQVHPNSFAHIKKKTLHN